MDRFLSTCDDYGLKVYSRNLNYGFWFPEHVDVQVVKARVPGEKRNTSRIEGLGYEHNALMSTGGPPISPAAISLRESG
jgi:hypothetical protein